MMIKIPLSIKLQRVLDYYISSISLFHATILVLNTLSWYYHLIICSTNCHIEYLAYKVMVLN